LIGQTKADVRDTMVEVGDSSILKISPPWFMPEYEPSKRRLTWPNGVQGIIYSGDEPDQLRGPQHAKAWLDEPAKFKYPQDTWDNLEMGLRVGDNPQAVVTTTPRPIKIIKNLVADDLVAVTRGHTMDNAANLSPQFLRRIISKYEGTRLGRQELAGEILDDNPGALWRRDKIDELRLTNHPQLRRVVVAIDPQGAEGEDTSDTGIVVAGVARIGEADHGYILADLSISGAPDMWAKAAISGYHNFKADRIVAEVNFGGDMVKATVKVIDPSVSFKSVRASRGKALRAEPVSALYEQNRIHHVGFFPELEDQMCLAEGTLVATDNGDKPIQTLEVGDMVWTRRGLRPVEGLRCNGVKDTLLLVTHLGYNIRATGNHPFANQSGDWIDASELSIGDKVLCLPQLNALMLNFREQIISWVTEATGKRAVLAGEDCYIERCGNRLMGLSQKVLKYITQMATEAITSFQILNLLPERCIVNSIPAKALQSLPLSNVASRCVNNGKPERVLKLPALNVGQSLLDALPTAISAPVNVINDTIVGIQKADPIRVWDLQVAAEHEYFAGGFLVHNCEWEPGAKSPDRLDAAVWAITELMLGNSEWRAL
jgi:phage terminase large subunit-like protein